jgi:hypothetical protein
MSCEHGSGMQNLSVPHETVWELSKALPLTDRGWLSWVISGGTVCHRVAGAVRQDKEREAERWRECLLACGTKSTGKGIKPSPPWPMPM